MSIKFDGVSIVFADRIGFGSGNYYFQTAGTNSTLAMRMVSVETRTPTKECWS